jgi:DNA-binding GntR family transcriptional regulator
MRHVNSIQPLPAITRRTQVVDALREAILSGALRPGTKITELDLAARFRVSRGPIREGIRQLIDEGLLESRPYSGTQVSVMDETAITEAYGLRRVLEKYAFSLVWPRRDAEFKSEFALRYQELIAAPRSGNITAEMAAELAFHSVPYDFSGNDLLRATWRQLSRRMQLGFVLDRSLPGCRDVVAMHAKYFELALGEDLDEMHAEVDRHIDLGLELMQPSFEGASLTSVSVP